jgi:hypothetical protein
MYARPARFYLPDLDLSVAKSTANQAVLRLAQGNAKLRKQQASRYQLHHQLNEACSKQSSLPHWLLHCIETV